MRRQRDNTAGLQCAETDVGTHITQFNIRRQNMKAREARAVAIDEILPLLRDNGGVLPLAEVVEQIGVTATHMAHILRHTTRYIVPCQDPGNVGDNHAVWVRDWDTARYTNGVAQRLRNMVDVKILSGRMFYAKT